MPVPPQESCFDVGTDGEVTTVRFRGDRIVLDEQSIVPVGGQLSGLVEELRPRHLSLDFGNVHYLTSTALAMFVDLHRKVLAHGGHLSLCRLRPHIYEIFEITKLNRLLDVLPEEV